MMRQGFTLIELIVSLLIGALLSISLTMMLQQSYASQKKLESLTNLYGRASLVFTQIERDLMGATVPIENILALEDERKKKGSKKKPEETQKAAEAAPENKEKKEAAPKEETEQKPESSKGEVPYKPFDRVFYCGKHGALLHWSWITHNPLQLYWGASVGTARPRIARIMYRLEPDKEDKTLFNLVRSEGFDLSYAPYEKHADAKYKGSVIAAGVKRMVVTSFAVQEKREEQVPEAKAGATKKSEKPPTIEVKTLETWEWPRNQKEQAEKKDKKDEQELPPLPQGVRIVLTLWDAASEREKTFESAIYIPSVPSLQRESQAQPTDKKEEKKEEGKTTPTPQEAPPTGPKPKMPQWGGGKIGFKQPTARSIFGKKA